MSMKTEQNSAATSEYGPLEPVSNPPVVGVIGIPTEHPAGAPGSGRFNADGTITILIAKSKVGSPPPGDILGASNGKTFASADSAPQTLESPALITDHTVITRKPRKNIP